MDILLTNDVLSNGMSNDSHFFSLRSSAQLESSQFFIDFLVGTHQGLQKVSGLTNAVAQHVVCKMHSHLWRLNVRRIFFYILATTAQNETVPEELGLPLDSIDAVNTLELSLRTDSVKTKLVSAFIQLLFSSLYTSLNISEILPSPSRWL